MAAELTCQDLVELVTDYLDGALPVPERERFERHFDACPHCALYLAQLREAITLTGRLTVEDVDALQPEARDELLAAFRTFQAD